MRKVCLWHDVNHPISVVATHDAEKISEGWWKFLTQNMTASFSKQYILQLVKPAAAAAAAAAAADDDDDDESYLFNNLSRLTAEKTAKLCITGHLWGESTSNPRFPTQRASNSENFPCHDVILIFCLPGAQKYSLTPDSRHWTTGLHFLQ